MTNQMNREIEIMYMLDHPHIVKLINHFEDDDFFYLIMEFAPKGHLYNKLAGRGYFTIYEAAKYFYQIVKAIEYIHSFDPPIIHRDLKLENLLVTENDDILVADFGWSNFQNEEIRTTLCGTPAYLSPEMIDKSHKHDKGVDIWSLGILLYEFLTGRAPFSGHTPEEMYLNIKQLKLKYPKDLDKHAENLISRLLDPKPEKRIKMEEILEHNFFKKYLDLNDANKLLVKTHGKKRLEEEILFSRVINPTVNLIEKFGEDKLNIKNQYLEIIKQKKCDLEKQKSEDNSDLTLNYQTFELNKQISGQTEPLDQKKDTNQKEEVELLRLENYELKESNDVLDNENKRLQEKVNSFYIRKHENISEVKFNEEKLKLLTELDEKMLENLKLKNKMKTLEEEILKKLDLINELSAENNKLNFNIKEKELLLKNTQEDTVNMKKEFELKIQKEIKKQKELQEELVSLRTKLIQDSFNNNQAELLNGQKDFNVSSLNTESNLKSLEKLIKYLITEPIVEVKNLLIQKADKLTGDYNEFKKDSSCIEEKISKEVESKYEMLVQNLKNLKKDLRNDIDSQLENFNKSEQNENSKKKIEWLKSQVKELSDYRLKLIQSESEKDKANDNLNKINAKYYNTSAQLEVEINLKKSLEDKVEYLKNNYLNAQDKLSKILSFTFQNCNKDNFIDLFVDTFNYVNNE